jgi:hypothetical protein
LNTYLVASATVMGIGNSGLTNYNLIISVDDYYAEEEAYKDYINELKIYSEETKSERLILIQKIRNEIENLN